MSRRKVTLVIVCEDVQQGAFARRYFEKRGFHSRKIRIIQNPPGRSSGEQFVRQQLIEEIRRHRQRRSSQDGLALVAIIDADTETVSARVKQINSALMQEGLDSIQPDERIAVFIPKRNIETWLRYAQGELVNEEQAYPKFRKPRSCREEVRTYVDTICKDGVPGNAPDSLKYACDELAKIL